VTTRLKSKNNKSKAYNNNNNVNTMYVSAVDSVQFTLILGVTYTPMKRTRSLHRIQ